MTLLCRVHHRAVHEGEVRVCIDVNGQVVFFTPKGKALLGAPPRGWDHRTGAQGEGNGRIDEEAETSAGEEESTGAHGAAKVSSVCGEGRSACEANMSVDSQEPRPYHLSGGSRWARDDDIPWETDARPGKRWRQAERSAWFGLRAHPARAEKIPPRTPDFLALCPPAPE